MRYFSRSSFLLLYCILLERNNQAKTTHITRTSAHRSSVLKTIQDYILLTNAFSVQATVDFFACAQSCLADSRCVSVNFHRVPNNGRCEMSADGIDGKLEECTLLYYSKGALFGQLVNVSDPVFQPEIGKPKRKEYIFTTLGASGRFGPTDTIEYIGTSLEGKVTINSGIQLWTVPETGNYAIETFGASGANGTCLGEVNCTGKEWRLGGLGAVMKGTFHFQKGAKLKILVGQKGSRTEYQGTRPGGGGGGTFVVRDDDDTPLIIAGGGGGGAPPKSALCLDGGPGLVGESGGVCGGSGGQGGKQCDESGNSADLAGGTGAGFNLNGKGFRSFIPGSYSFLNGGNGGKGPFPDMVGAFGGGGFGLQNPGGGGGYSGGGMMGTSSTGQAGGGGSYNNGTNQTNKEGMNKGDGKVIITHH